MSEDPAAFGRKDALIALLNTLRKHIRDAGSALVMDLRDATGEEPTAVWNHAVYRYVTRFAQDDVDLFIVQGQTTLYANQDTYSDDGASTGMPARPKVVDGDVRPVRTTKDKRVVLYYQVRFRWTGGLTQWSDDNRWLNMKTVPSSGSGEMIHAPRWSRIWNHPENAALRQRRGSPDLLMAGDELVIPEDAVDDAALVPAGSRAVFVVRASTDVLRLRLRGVRRFIADFGPIPYVLRAGDEIAEGKITGEDQILEVPLRDSVSTAELVLMGITRYELDIGGLGPVSEAKGALGRLGNIGYVAQVHTNDAQRRADPLATAIARFQFEHGLPVTGELDDETQRRLQDEYGT